MITAVCDTSTLIRLYKGNALHCLSELFEQIYIPEAVLNECHDEVIKDAISQQPFELKVVKQVLPIGMGAGEREAISLAVETGTKYLFTDDERAFKKAEAHGLIPLRSFRLLILGKQTGLITSVTETLNTMEKAGEGIDPALYFETIKDAGEL